ncbi:MAG: SusC/RagA family TonB-linked outer membrane protein [Muribaculaceae bacterium]
MRKTILQRLGVGILCCFALGAGTAYAGTSPNPQSTQQSVKVNGIVKDSNGDPIVGASVLVKGTTSGVSTDLDGRFSLNAGPNDVLIVNYVGMKSREVKASESSIIVLSDDAAQLDELVVLGYGAAQKKQDLSAAVGVVRDAESLAQRPVTSTEGMLQGQLPGVTIESNGGDPTSTPSIVIRGQGSQNGDNVLWVVDGIPGAPIPSISDIESVVVLKDAASAAIYGAVSGAGGCVLVTTKKAKEGAVSVSYDGVVGIRQASNLPKGLTAEQQIEMRKISYANAGLSLPDGWDTTKNPWVGTNRTDWMDEIFRTALYHRHNVSLNTGTESAKNRFSFAYDSNDGTLINTYDYKTTLHYDGSFKINKWVTINEDLTWRSSKSRTKDTNSGYTGVILSAIMMPSSASVYQADGSFGGTTTEDPEYIARYGSNYADIHGDAVNPVRLLTAENNYDRTSDLWSTTSLTVGNIIPGLKFVSRYTYNQTNNYYKHFNPRRPEVGKPQGFNTLTESSYRYSKWLTENTLTYDNTFGKHTVGALLSTTADRTYTRGMQIEGKDISDESEYLQYMAFADSYSVDDWLTGPDANVAIIARASYSFDDRYFLTASWRRDYASRLPKENNYGDFPAVTAAWKISNEKFFPKSNAINLLKIRGSWGRVGNLGSIGYNYKSANLSKTTWNEQAQYGVENNSTWMAMWYLNSVVNPNLTWETSEQFDLGLDASLLNNRLSISLDYYNKRTFNLIQTQSMNWPSYIGLSAQLVNMGEVRNRGFEAQITWSDKVNKDWSYFVTGNLAYNSNKVTDIGVKDSEGNSGVWSGDGSFRNIPYIYQTCEGEPVNSFYLIRSLGIFQSDAEAQAYTKDGNMIQPNAKAGDLKFEDYNGDGKIDNADRQYMGSATPKWTYALTAGFTWKDLSVSAMFQGVGGAQAFYAGKYMLLSDVEGNFNRSAEILNAWSPSNTGSDIPLLSKNDPNSNFSTASSWYLEDADYLRLKNLTVSYDLTRAIRQATHLGMRSSSLSVYFSAENLFTITSYSGVDPECGGWDALKYPVSKVYSFGVKLTY